MKLSTSWQLCQGGRGKESSTTVAYLCLHSVFISLSLLPLLSLSTFLFYLTLFGIYSIQYILHVLVLQRLQRNKGDKQKGGNQINMRMQIMANGNGDEGTMGEGRNGMRARRVRVRSEVRTQIANNFAVLFTVRPSVGRRPRPNMNFTSGSRATPIGYVCRICQGPEHNGPARVWWRRH